MMRNSRWPTAAALLLITGPLSAQAANLTKSPRELCASFNRPGVSSIAGIVRENTGAPVPFATVNFEGGYTTEALADRTGCFAIRSPRSSQLTVDVRRIGFQAFSQTLDLSGDSTVFIDVRLSSVAAQITGVQVTAPRNDAMERTGFYDRMLEREKGAGDGYFITPEDLERRNEDKITHVLEGYPNVRVQYDPRTGDGVVVGRGLIAPSDGKLPTATTGPIAPSRDCVMSIWLDGARITGVSIDQITSPSNLAAIEIYPNAMQTPPQYQTTNGDGACGAVVAWTQRPDFTRNGGSWWRENLLTIIVVPVLLIAVLSTIHMHP